MADIVSRAFKTGKFFNAQNNLTAYFNVHFPLPQNLSSSEYTPPARLTQRVMSCLRGEPLTMGSLLRLPKIGKNTGLHGPTTQDNGASTRFCKTAKKLTSSSSSLPLLQGSGQVISEEAMKLKLLQSQKRSQPSQRPSVWLDNPVPSKRQKTTISFPSNS